MKRTAFVAFGWVVALGTMGSACGPTIPGSCSITSNGSAIGAAVTSCTDYGTGYSQNSAMSQCVAPEVYSNTPCTTINRLGRCVVTTMVGATASSSITISYYPTTVTVPSDGGGDGGTMTETQTVADAMANCAARTNAATATSTSFVTD